MSDELRDKMAQRGIDERNALDGLFEKILKENNKVRYSIYHTPEQTVSKYDCLVKQYDKATGKVLKKMFFEVKIRGMHYDTLLIEKQKLLSMKMLVRDLDIDKIYYVNFTPKNTSIFDLLKIEEKLVFVNDHHNKATVDKSQGKVTKEVAYMDTTDATVVDFVYIPKTITPEEYQAFIDVGTVSNDRLTAIAEKVINHEMLNDMERAIFTSKASEVEDIIKVFISPHPQIQEEDLLQNVEVTNPTDPEFEAFPKEPDQNQITLDLKEEKRVIRKDENGQLIYNSLSELPLNLQWLAVAQRRIKLWLKPGEDRLKMIEQMGGEIQLGDFLSKRAMDELMARYGVKR